MKIDAIMASEQDNVATSLREIQENEKIIMSLGDQTRPVRILGKIPHGHKFAVKEILKGENIIKHGEVIGRATQDIREGTHAHIQNIESLRGRGKGK